jgi:cold shock CspA family protein
VKKYFFQLSAIPSSGYRTVIPGAEVRFELVELESGLRVRNIRRF